VSAAALRRAAARFQGPAGLPRLWFFTDPERTPHPWRVAEWLPEGVAVVYRHFGHGDRRRVAHRLQHICARRGLRLLIGADPALAAAIGADGVHLPERMAALAHDLKRARPDWIISVASHSAAATRRVKGADTIILSPIYPSRSPSAGPPLGRSAAAAILLGAPAPVIALGGVTLARMPELARAGFAGAAGIDLFAI